MSAPNNNSAEKPRLSAEQKKANHIESERKRRDTIRQRFEKLADLVPDCEGQARSEGTVLAATVNYIQQLQVRTPRSKRSISGTRQLWCMLTWRSHDLCRTVRVRCCRPSPLTLHPKKS